MLRNIPQEGSLVIAWTVNNHEEAQGIDADGVGSAGLEVLQFQFRFDLVQGPSVWIQDQDFFL